MNFRTAPQEGFLEAVLPWKVKISPLALSLSWSRRQLITLIDHLHKIISGSNSLWSPKPVKISDMDSYPHLGFLKSAVDFVSHLTVGNPSIQPHQLGSIMTN